MTAIRQETLTESRDSDPLDLDAETVAALRQLGQRLASQSSVFADSCLPMLAICSR